jgi:hypothetical protein
MVYKRVLNFQNTQKIMTPFHQIPKLSIDLIAKWVENYHTSCGLNVLRY